MTAHDDLKKHVRARQQKTGESYMAASVHVLRERAERLGLPTDAVPRRAPAEQVAAVVLRVNRDTARVRFVGADTETTLRCPGAALLLPGEIVPLTMGKRWRFQGAAYASGVLGEARIEVGALGLEALPLEGGELDDVRAWQEPPSGDDDFARLWRARTAEPRASWEMARALGSWGTIGEPDDDAVSNAAELRAAGDGEGAREILMQALHADLRNIDAHAALGNLVFDRFPERASRHYEIGARIGELSLPPGFDGYLHYGDVYNRPYLRCLAGLGLGAWRVGDFAAAIATLERVLMLSPADPQGMRFCWAAARRGEAWLTMSDGAPS